MELTKDDARFIAKVLRREADRVEHKCNKWGLVDPDPGVVRARRLADELEAE